MQWAAVLKTKDVRKRRLYWRHSWLLPYTRNQRGRILRTKLPGIWRVSRSQAWRIVKEGEKQGFWRVDRKHGFLYIVGRSALSRLLGSPETEDTVSGIPGDRYRDFVGHATARLICPDPETWYAVTRTEIQRCTGLAPVSQRRYERVAGVKTLSQVGVGDRSYVGEMAGPVHHEPGLGDLWTLPNLYRYCTSGLVDPPGEAQEIVRSLWLEEC